LEYELSWKQYEFTVNSTEFFDDIKEIKTDHGFIILGVIICNFLHLLGISYSPSCLVEIISKTCPEKW